MKKMGKKFMALAMTSAMVMGVMPATGSIVTKVNAADSTTEVTADLATTQVGNVGGVGTVEGGDVKKDVVCVVLPVNDTSSTSLSTLQFTLDPQLLITDSNGAKDTTKTFEPNASLYFPNTAEGKTYDYSSTSDPLTITNKSSIPVDVTLTPTFTASTLTDSTNTISVDTDGDFSGVTAPSIYMALVNQETSAETVLASSGGSTNPVTVSLDEAPEGSYELTYSSGTYAYVLKSDASGFDSVDFALTGAVNTDVDWSAHKSLRPTVDLAWSLAEGTKFEGSKPTFASSSAGTIDITAGATDYASITIDSVVATKGTTTYDILTDYAGTASATQITFDKAALYNATGKGTVDVTITYTATHSTVSGKKKTLTTTITVPLK